MHKKQVILYITLITTVASTMGYLIYLSAIKLNELYIFSSKRTATSSSLQTSTPQGSTESSRWGTTEWQAITSNLFSDYNSCLPHHIAPRKLKENDYPYDYLIDISICTHDAMKRFANELDVMNGNNDFIDSLRFGSCDECSEAYFPPRSPLLR